MQCHRNGPQHPWSQTLCQSHHPIPQHFPGPNQCPRETMEDLQLTRIPGHLREGLAMSLGSSRGKWYLEHRVTHSLFIYYFLINLSSYYFFGWNLQEYIKKRSPVRRSLNFSLPKGWTAAGHRNMLDNLSSLKTQHCPLIHTMMGRTRACCYPEPKPQTDTRAMSSCVQQAEPMTNIKSKDNQV